MTMVLVNVLCRQAIYINDRLASIQRTGGSDIRYKCLQSFRQQPCGRGDEPSINDCI
jgi:hypothetical protein